MFADPFLMPSRARSEGGFLMIELLAAVVVIAIALLALLAAYDQAFFSLRSAAKTSSAGQVAENQLELYASLPYSAIGLDETTLGSVQSSDSTYSSDEAALPGSGTDVTISGCGTSAECSPVQTLTGSDHHSYKLETFIRSVVNVTNSDGSTWNEKVVTVLVRALDKTGAPVAATMQTAFDAGPS